MIETYMRRYAINGLLFMKVRKIYSIKEVIYLNFLQMKTS